MTRRNRSIYTIEDCHRVAAERGGECLSSSYQGYPFKMKWMCRRNHKFLAFGFRILKGFWCQKCRIKEARDVFDIRPDSKKMIKSKYIYILSDPITGHPKYIGKTERKPITRYKEHLIVNRKGTNTSACPWVKELKKCKMMPVMELMEEFSTFEEMNNAEVFYIEYFRYLGFDILNTSKGGNGAYLGFKMKTKRTVQQRLATAKRMGGVQFYDQYGNMYKTQRECADKLKILQAKVCEVLAGNRKHTNGFIFSYEKPQFPVYGPIHLAAGFGTEEYIVAMAKSCGGKGKIIDQNGRIYLSQRSAGKILGLQSGNISKVLNGKVKTTGGYAFRYLDS